MENIAKHITFKGRVQGIGFRFTALSIASRCQLTGIVRNLGNGTVEMFAQGAAEDIDDCVNDINESFPDSISDTTIENASYNPQYEDFRITF